MPEIKRSADIPPQGLQRAVIRLSESQSWNEAKKEWRMASYYYVPEYITCPCSPRAVHNITVLVNKFNFNELLVCNSCSERYFACKDSSTIENSVWRLKKNVVSSMNRISLDYLLKNRVIDAVEHYNYEKLRGLRACSKDDIILVIRKQTNVKLIHFTDYNNKKFFDKIDQILIWAMTHSGMNIRYIANIRNNLLRTNQCQAYQLNDFIREHEIEESIGNKMDARKLLDKFIETSCIFAGKKGWPFATYRWASAEEYIVNRDKYIRMKYSELNKELETMDYERLKAVWEKEEQVSDFNSKKSNDLGDVAIDDDWDNNNLDDNDWDNDDWNYDLNTHKADKKILPEFSDKWLEGLEDWDEGPSCEEDDDYENDLDDFDFSTPVLSRLRKPVLQNISSFVFKYAKDRTLGIFLEIVLPNKPIQSEISNVKELDRLLEKGSFEGLCDGLINLVTYSNVLRKRYLMEKLNRILIANGMEITEDQWGKIHIRYR